MIPIDDFRLIILLTMIVSILIIYNLSRYKANIKISIIITLIVIILFLILLSLTADDWAMVAFIIGFISMIVSVPIVGFIIFIMERSKVKNGGRFPFIKVSTSIWFRLITKLLLIWLMFSFYYYSLPRDYEKIIMYDNTRVVEKTITGDVMVKQISIDDKIIYDTYSLDELSSIKGKIKSSDIIYSSKAKYYIRKIGTDDFKSMNDKRESRNNNILKIPFRSFYYMYIRIDNMYDQIDEPLKTEKLKTLIDKKEIPIYYLEQNGEYIAGSIHESTTKDIQNLIKIYIKEVNDQRKHHIYYTIILLLLSELLLIPLHIIKFLSKKNQI